jgi:hypothetical protein
VLDGVQLGLLWRYHQNELLRTIVFLLVFATWVARGVSSYLRDRKESAATSPR